MKRFEEDVILLHICVSERAVLQDGVVFGGAVGVTFEVKGVAPLSKSGSY